MTMARPLEAPDGPNDLADRNAYVLRFRRGELECAGPRTAPPATGVRSNSPGYAPPRRPLQSDLLDAFSRVSESDLSQSRRIFFRRCLTMTASIKAAHAPAFAPSPRPTSHAHPRTPGGTLTKSGGT